MRARATSSRVCVCTGGGREAHGRVRRRSQRRQQRTGRQTPQSRTGGAH